MGVPAIFFSYAREDRARVAPVVAALEARGWSVFWDPHLSAGTAWRTQLSAALDQARCVVVAWSGHSIQSPFVRDEAARGQRRHILVPVLIDLVDPPLGFGEIQAADLLGWSPEHPSPAFDSFLADLSAVLDAPGPQGASTLDVAFMPMPVLPADEDAANQPTAAAASSMTDCDWLAANPTDGQKHPDAPGVRLEDLDPARAIPACEAAVARWPQEPRFAYQYGRALMKANSENEAIRWYLKAEQQGYTAARNELAEQDFENAMGHYWRMGDTVRRLADTEEQGEKELASIVINKLRPAADRNHAKAQYSLGQMYEEGMRDQAEAVRWYRKAADQGHTEAQYRLGQIYSFGELYGVFLLGQIYEDGKGVALDQAEAARWYRMAADQGHTEAQYTLGQIYEDGKGVALDQAEAARWYRMAANQGNADAKKALARLERTGWRRLIPRF